MSKAKRTCHKCGCSYSNACVHKKTGLSCTWVGRNFCSACLPGARREYHRPVLEPQKKS